MIMAKMHASPTYSTVGRTNAKKKRASSKFLTIMGVIWFFLFFPVGIVLLVKASRRKREELAEAAAAAAPRPSMTDEEVRAVLDSVCRSRGVPTTRLHAQDYEYHGVDVCILRGTDPDLSRVSEGDPADLVLEPENDYDPQAVAVYLDGERVGYLYKGRLKKMVFDFLTRGDSVVAEVSAVGGDWLKIDLSLSK